MSKATEVLDIEKNAVKSAETTPKGTADVKADLRRQMLERRNSLCPDDIKDSADAFLRGMQKLHSYQTAQTVMLYMSFQKEVPTHSLIRQAWQDGKRVVLPRIDKSFTIRSYYVDSFDQLLTSPMGIGEPDPDICDLADPLDLDLVLIPGIAFDLRGGRIGFGKACYDRFLPTLRWNAEKIALAYEIQVLDRVPTDPRDVPMDGILTETRFRQCQSACPTQG